MRAHNRAVEQEPFAVGFVGTGFKQRLPNAFIAPAREAFVNAIPVAIFFRQQPPLCTAAGDPKHGFDKAPTFGFIADIDARTRF